MKKLLCPILIVFSVSILGICGCANPSNTGNIALAKNSYSSLTTSLQKEVESFRGKNFKRNLAIAVYTKEEYRAIVGEQVSSLTAEKRRLYNNIYICEGLMRKNADYFGGYDSLMSEQVGGFYSDGTDTVNIILQDDASGPTLDDSITIFHELVHAMQDQYYNLNTLQKNVSTTDQSYALTYVIEGEAELLSMYYSYKLYYGYYPSYSSTIMEIFDRYETIVEDKLDSIHNAGKPLVVRQPMWWAYYSYGPKFINAVANGSWQVIDNTIFVSLPKKTGEVLYPATYTSDRKEYLLDGDGVTNYIDSLNVIVDFDELGVMMTSVMFREWDFYNYKNIAAGLLVDQMIVYRDVMTDSLRLAWATVWKDSTTAASFLANYTSLANKKLNISLPLPTQATGRNSIDDAANRVYIEQFGATVFILENYIPQQFPTLVEKMRTVKPYLRTLAKRADDEPRKYPLIDKTLLTKGIRHFQKQHFFF